MGSVEDDEPSLKLAELSFEEPTEEHNEVVGSKGVVKKVELVRIIVEALYSLGYRNAGARLEEESRIFLHSTTVNLFRQQIIDGKWDESVVTLHHIGRIDEPVIKLASFVILEKKFFELLDGGKPMDALKTLRTEIAPLRISHDRVRELSVFIISPSQDILNEASGQEWRLKSRENLLEELQNLLPPIEIVPENRLVNLVEQALDLQKVTCSFHNLSVGEFSLLTKHQCGRERIPSQTLQILEQHGDEVWCLQFSKNGKYLASASRDFLVIIWEVENTGRVSLRHILYGHTRPVCRISWSPDGLQLLSCGVEEVIRRWDISSGQCLHVYEKVGLSMTSCAWAPDGKNIFTGVTNGTICMWDLEGNEVGSWSMWNLLRTSDLVIPSNRKEFVTLVRGDIIVFYAWESNSLTWILENQPIVSFSLSEDSKFLLVSLSNQELHLWNVDGRPERVEWYTGHKNSRFVVKSCFGGFDQAFIASGSEDSLVYIWDRVTRDLICTLAGHSAAVNCVSWNPVNPHILASAGDDHTIRIWRSTQVDWKFHG